LTLDSALSTAANFATGAVVYGGFNFSTVITTTPKYLYTLVEKADHSWLYGPGAITGMKVSNFSAGSGLRYAFDYQGDAVAAGFAPSSFVDNETTFTGAPLVGVGSPVFVNAGEIFLNDISVDFGTSKTAIGATSGTNGRGGWENVESMPSGELTSYYQSALWTKYDAATPLPLRLSIQLGGTNAARARGALGIFVPQAQITISNDDGEVNDQVAMKMNWKAIRPDVVTQASLNKSVYFTVFGGI
jgi:hypothetical protein